MLAPLSSQGAPTNSKEVLMKPLSSGLGIQMEKKPVLREQFRAAADH